MKSIKSVRNSILIKNTLSNFLKVYKVFLIVLALVLLLGVVTGIFTASKYSGSLEMEHIPDSNFVSFICGDKGSLGLFFTYFVNYCILFVIVIFVCTTPLFNVLIYLCFLVLGYRLGFLISALITLFSFAGIINVVIIILPFELLLMFVFMLLCSIVIHRNKIRKKFGCINSNTNYKKIYLFLVIIFFVILFIKCLIMPVINVTIIVN